MTEPMEHRSRTTSGDVKTQLVVAAIIIFAVTALAIGCFYPFYLIRSASYVRTHLDLSNIAMCIEEYREQHGRYPPGTGRRFLTDLRSSLEADLQLEVHDYAPSRVSLTYRWRRLLHTCQPTYEFRPFGPIPPPRPFRGPRRPLEGLDEDTPIVCVRPSDRSEDLYYLTLEGWSDSAKPGSEAYRLALEHTTDAEE